MCLLQAIAWRMDFLVNLWNLVRLQESSAQSKHKVLESNCFPTLVTRLKECLAQYQTPEGAQ